MGPAYILGAVFIWSFVPLLVKHVLPVFSPAWIAAFRLLAGGLVLLPAALLAPRPPARRGMAGLLAMGGAGIAGNYVLYSTAMLHTTASAGTVVIQVEMLFLVVLSVFLLHESMGRVKLAGTIIAFSGVLLVAWRGESWASLSHSRYFLGNVIMLGSGLCWAFYGLAQKMVADCRPGATGVAPMLLIGGAVSLVAAARQPVLVGPATPLDWLLLLPVLGFVCTGVSYLLLSKGFRRMEASTGGMLTTTLPLMTIVEAHLLIGEPITPYLLVGAALVIGGITLVMLERPAANGRQVRY